MTATPATQQPPGQSSALVNANSSASSDWYSFFVGQFQTVNGQVSTLAEILPFFQSQEPNLVLASPDGEDGGPLYRSIASGDLAGVAGEFPGTATDDSAAAGNVGEYISDEVVQAAAVVLSNGVATDVATIDLTAGDWDVWASVATTGSGAISSLTAWANTASATDPGAPNGGLYLVSATGSPQPVGMMRVSLPAGPSTALFLSIKAGFTGAASGYGFLGARRAR